MSALEMEMHPFASQSINGALAPPCGYFTKQSTYYILESRASKGNL